MKAGEGLVGLIAEKAEVLNISDAQLHPRSPTSRRGRGDLQFLPRRADPQGRQHDRRPRRAEFRAAHLLRGGTEALQTTAMVIAEMIAAGGLETISNQAAGGIALRKPLSLTGAPIAEGVGLGHVVLHEPRIVIKNLVADDPAAEEKRLEEALQALQASIDVLIDGDGSGPGEHREILETFGCSRMTAAGCAACARRSPPAHGRGGGGARAVRHGGPSSCARPILTCASVCMISRISPTACCTSSPARPSRWPPARCRRTPSSSPAPWAPPPCWSTSARGCAA